MRVRRPGADGLFCTGDDATPVELRDVGIAGTSILALAVSRDRSGRGERVAWSEIGSAWSASTLHVREAGSAGDVLKSTVALNSPRGKIEFRQVLRLSAGAGEPVDYALEVAIPGAVQEIRARKTATGWTIEAGPTGAPTLTRENPIAGPAVLLDNNLASHLDLINSDHVSLHHRLRAVEKQSKQAIQGAA